MIKALRVFFITLGILFIIAGSILFFSSFTQYDSAVVFWFENISFDLMVFLLWVSGLGFLVLGSMFKK